MLDRFETIAKALSDRNRLRILKLLEEGELCGCQIGAVLEQNPPAVSKALAALRQAGLLEQRRQGRWIYYRLADPETNPLAEPMLRLVAGALAGDPRVIADKTALARVNALSPQTLCDGVS